MTSTPLKVLYVEDYAPVAALVRETLRRRAPEIELDVVATVAQAIAQLEQSRHAPGRVHYDVVLTDLNLPDGQGLEVLAHVRDRGWPLAVVILSASADEGGAADALSAAADGYVPKRDDYLMQLPSALHAAAAKFRSAQE